MLKSQQSVYRLRWCQCLVDNAEEETDDDSREEINGGENKIKLL